MRNLVIYALAICCLSGCYNKVLPGVAFGPGGRLVTITGEDLRREAGLIGEQVNAGLNDNWYAEVAVDGLPTEDIDRPYKDRWQWQDATIALKLWGNGLEKAPPVSPSALKQAAEAIMRKATTVGGHIVVELESETISVTELQQKMPGWVKHIRQATSQ